MALPRQGCIFMETDVMKRVSHTTRHISIFQMSFHQGRLGWHYLLSPYSIFSLLSVSFLKVCYTVDSPQASQVKTSRHFVDEIVQARVANIQSGHSGAEDHDLCLLGSYYAAGTIKCFSLSPDIFITNL